MRIWWLAYELLAAACAATDVVVLTEETFEEHIRQHTYTMVKFYAPWCGHCKKLAPVYEAAAAGVKDKGVALAKIDATVEKAIASKFHVKGFPTLVWFEEGRNTEYDGGRTTQSITDWVHSMIGPAVLPAESMEAINQSAEKPVVVLRAESLLPSFELEAKLRRRKAQWHFIQAPGEEPRVTLRHKEEAPVVLTGDVTDSEKLSAFVASHMLPLFGRLDAETYDRYIESEKGLVWSLFPSGPEGFAAVEAFHRPVMLEVARRIRERYFVTITDTERFKEAIENMLGVSEFPVLAVQKKAGEKRKFLYTGEMTVEKISAFIEDIDADKVEPSLRSDPVPKPSEAPVKVVVASTLQTEVFSPDKDVMLEVYAPWCGHCKKLEPEYIKLAKKIRKEELSDLVTVAKMDGTTNDSPVDSIEWTSFPTIFFVKANQSEVLTYDGERNAKSLWKYIRRNASRALEIRDRLEKRKGGAGRSEEL